MLVFFALFGLLTLILCIGVSIWVLVSQADTRAERYGEKIHYDKK